MDVDAFLANEGKNKSFDFDKELTDYFKQQDVKPGKDFFQSIPTGVVKGLTGIAGTGATAQGVEDKIGGDLFGPQERLPDPSTGPISRYLNSIASTLGFFQGGAMPFQAPDTGQLYKDVQENVTGPLHEPQTTAGEYGQTFGEFLPSAIGGPSTMLRAGLIPALSSETAGQFTKGTPYETAARIAGGLAGPMAFEHFYPGARPVPGAQPRGPDAPPNAAGLREELGPTPDRGYPGVPATRGTSQPEAYTLHPEVLPPRPGARPEPIDVEGEVYTTPPNARGMKESVGSTSEAYPSTPMRYQDPFTHWPVTEHPMPGEPPRATGAPMAGRGPAPMLALPGARPVPQEPGPMPVPRAQENQPRTTTVGKQPTDVKVYGDFEVGADAMMEKTIAGQKMTAPMGKITELYLKPEKVLKPNPVPGQGASKITTTEQVPYAKFADGREAPLSQLKKVNAPQTSPDKVKEMLKAPKKEPVPEVDDKTIIKEIRRIMNETGSKVTYSNVKKVLPNMSRNGFERAFERMKEQDPSLIKATNKETKEQFIARGKVDAETRLKASEAEKSKHFDKAIKQLRGKENLKYAYLRNLMDTTNLEKVGARLNVKAATQRVNQMIKDGAIKVYPEGEPESPVKSVTQGMFSPLDEDIDYVIEFIKKS
jgi:hypothetical protein